ncbi:MAG: phosphatidate cytidylyltransferase [Flavobacteriales bacterium]|jgi:phosphatidate cytidylyltransferase|nr:phosphatidate cytidylyltransferase [Flavobacteriales bacterium]
MNELITRSFTGVVFVTIVVFATTFDIISASILWAVVLAQGLKEYKILKGSPLGYLLITIAVVSLWGMGRPFDAWVGFIPYYRGWDVVAFLTWIWANDTFAYIGGKVFGKKFIKRGLAPKASPNKSWEGAFIGAVGAAFVGWLWMGNEGALLGVLTGTLSTLGDLVQSALKRHAGVKDSGNLLPGHGGVLDRFDGLLIAAPVVLLLRVFIL